MRKTKNTITFVFVIFALAGLVAIIVAIALAISDANFRSSANETTATITDIWASRNSDGEGSYTVNVRFFAGGREYGGALGYWHSGMAIGNEVKVYYNPNNPQDFRSNGGSVASWIVMALGVVFFVVGFIPYLISKKRKALKKYLLANGKRIMATVNDVVWGNVYVNNRPCYNIICEYKDESTGNVYMFKSENVWITLPRLGEGQAMPYISVYVDCNDYSKHYVDVDSFFAGFAEYGNVIDYT